MAKKLDITALAARLTEMNESSNRGDGLGMGFISIKDGRNVVRILPPRDDMDSFAVEAWVHYGVGKNSNNKNGQMVVCPTTNGENNPCPICELSKELKNLSKKKDDQYDKQARQHYRKKRVYYNAIDRADSLDNYEKREEDGKQVWYNKETDKKESPVKVLATGIGVFKDLLKLIVDPEYGDITDAEEGLDVVIEKSGSGQFNTNYDVRTVRKESAIGFDEWESCLNDMKPLLKVKSYDELANLLEGKETSSAQPDEVDIDDQVEDATSILPDKSEPDTTSGGDDDLQAEIKAALARRKAGK